MNTIAKNEYYTIVTDKNKNRLYLTVEGFWKNRDAVPNYITDMKKALDELSREYTILADVSRMKPPPAEIAAVHNESQKQAIAAGLKKTAEIVGEDVIAKMTVDRYAKESGMPKMTFSDKKEAEAWLDKD